MVKNVRAEIAAAGGIMVTWSHDQSGPPENFEVQVQPDSGEWLGLAVVPFETGQSDYSYLHENPVGSVVRYKVRAANQAGTSAWVESNSVPVIVIPNAPTNVQAS